MLSANRKSNASGLFSIFSDINVDWIMLGSVLIISFLGLLTMASFNGDDTYVVKQISWLLISVFVFFFLSTLDYGFLKKTKVVAWIFVISIGLLATLFLIGHIAKGAEKWFSLGGLSFQPSDPVKLGLIILLAKYFSRRHVEIANIRHILVSGFYALVIAILIFLQPDLGSALIVFFIWLGMILVSGVSKKHLFAVFFLGLSAFSVLWFYGLKDYQKQRVINFVHPLANIQGSGYNAYQATIAIGSGKCLARGSATALNPG